MWYDGRMDDLMVFGLVFGGIAGALAIVGGWLFADATWPGARNTSLKMSGAALCIILMTITVIVGANWRF